MKLAALGSGFRAALIAGRSDRSRHAPGLDRAAGRRSGLDGSLFNCQSHRTVVILQLIAATPAQWLIVGVS